MKSKINKIIRYWTDCIKHEDTLAKDIIFNTKKTFLCPFDSDYFVFNKINKKVKIKKSEISKFINFANIQKQDIYYGYPLLFYRNKKDQKIRIAPLFIIKLNYKQEKKETFLYKEGLIPSCGIKALEKIGLKKEEIIELNKEIKKIFNKKEFTPKEKSERCLKIFLENKDVVNEKIDPKSLSNNKKFFEGYREGVYNKSIIFLGESSFFNKNLIDDLIVLQSKNDLNKTALSFLDNKDSDNSKKEKSFINNFILPFPLDEYQIDALQSIFKSKISVITGPPGTGKSQFIMDLLVNLFLNNKKALFVSHTNEAVDVVNKKLDEKFKNLLFRTGNKEARQNLINKFNELSFDFQKKRPVSISKKQINILWDRIILLKKDILKIEEIEKGVAELIEKQKLRKSLITFFKLNFFIWRLKKKEPKIFIEKKIKRLEKKYFKLSNDYVKTIYLKRILNKWQATNKAKNFLHKIENIKFNENVSESFFEGTLDVLRIWSSTLKSLNRSFPLEAGIFDYVIFDEASQIDLPSAAPALYRAKRAVVVGDQMQLLHIAAITKDLDLKLAKKWGLYSEKDIYPAKIRYYDISLYGCAESFLDRPPLLLAKHYRSDDQIINLCNDVFYNGKLIISSDLNYSDWPTGLPVGIQWENCEGAVIKSPEGGRLNIIEAQKVNDVFQNILKKLKGTNISVGIVTPYSSQQRAIYNIITKTTPIDILQEHEVTVLTAHKFQGTEKDIIIFSQVISSKGNSSDRWYNFNPQILNVALSRAKYLLYIVGDKRFCLKRRGILKKIAKTFDKIKEEEKFEKHCFSGNFDTYTEQIIYQKLREKVSSCEDYELIPKYIEKRYTLDFALIKRDKRIKIDIECDGLSTHNIVNGLPVIEDIERDNFLKKQGWIILRFPNYMIYNNMNKVMEKILEVCQ